MPFRKRLLKDTEQRGMGAAWTWHGMCDLASAVQRRHVGDMAAFGFHAEFHEGYQKHTNPLNCRTSSSDISVYHTNFNEGHGNCRRTAGARHGMCELRETALLGNGMGAAWHVGIGF
jgi:hypothetical protein